MIACWHLIGGGDAEAPGRIGWGVVEEGWMRVAGLFTDSIAPVLEECRSPSRVFLHNPFGLHDTPHGRAQMSLHQERYAEADDRLDLVTGTFKPAWAPIIRAGAEVVAYVGFDETKSRPLTKLNTLQQSFNRILGTGCAVAFDSAGVWGFDRTEPNIVRLFQAWGVKCYVEGKPLDHWQDTPAIIDATSDDSWQTLPERKSETVVRVNAGLSVADQLVQAKKIQGMGFTAAIDAWTLIHAGEAVVAAFGK